MASLWTVFSLELIVRRFCVNSAEGLGGRRRKNHASPTSATTTATVPMAAFLCRLIRLAAMTESDVGSCSDSRGTPAGGVEDTAADGPELVSRLRRFKSARISA